MTFGSGIDPEERHRLIEELVLFRRWRRRNGLPPSALLDDLLRGLLATDGQAPPSCASCADNADALAMTYEAVARQLSVSERTVQRAVADGRLRAVDLLGCRRILAADLVAFVESVKAAP